MQEIPKMMCDCGKLGTWMYMPRSEVACDECVPRGCSCQDGDDEPCVEWWYDEDGYEVEESAEDVLMKSYNKYKEKKMERKEVYKAIDSERDYQDSRWNEDTTISKNIHTLEDWYMYIEDYINEGKHILSREARQDSNPKALEILRKVSAMAVCAMEAHGVNQREGFEK